jgi:hypothetical protein
MKKLHIAMAIAASVSTAAIAQAQDYQIEGGLSYSTTSFDAANNSPTAIKLDGTYHTESVSTSGVVLNEAAFVGRNNNINAAYTQNDSDTGADSTDATDIGVEWWFENIYAAANMQDTDGFGTNTIQLGYMLQENTLVALVMQTGDQAEDGMGLRAKYVGDNTNLEAMYVDTDGNTATAFGGDYYFSDTLSAGLMLADSDAATDGTTTISVKNFFTPVISGELDYAMTGDDSTTTLRAAMRF